MTKAIPVLVFIAALTVPAGGQPLPSIQGVWRNVERVIPVATAPGERSDPFAHVPPGTQTNVQPGLLIFTKHHYSRTTDTAVEPRPKLDPTTAAPTVEELQARWGPFQANAGTYDVSGDTVTLQPFVAKEPREQGGGSFARLTVRLEANTLSLTPIANSRGRIVAGVTSKYVRVE